MKIQSNMYINNPDMTSRNIEKKENSSHALVQEDDIQISDSARKLVETARNKVSDFHTMHFSSINGEIREIPAEYKCENLFKLDLKATSISGEQSAFEGCSENQSEVFEKWLDENASEYLTEDEMKDLKEKINAMTADVDSLNAQEGYRGTSYESVFLLSASEAGLRKVNEMYVPEQFQAGFSDMIDEYVHFNDSARNSIMERMTPDYMVVGIGSKTESYKYKSEIISDETAFYTNEKKEISGICKMDEQNNLTEVVETKNIVKTATGAESDGKVIDVDSLVSMNMWGLTPDFLDVLEEGFKEFFEKEVPSNPLKAEYLIPIFIGELLEQGNMSVKVLKTNDTWYGMTYHEDVAAVKESFKKMLENGVYKADLFSDL